MALACAATTAWTLLEDVVAGHATLTSSHIATALALALAVAAGHAALPELRAGKIVNGLLLALLGVGATSYVMIAAAARNAETAEVKVRAIEARNAARGTARQLLEEAMDDHMAAKKAADTECAKIGRQCELKRREQAKADSHRLLLTARVDGLGRDEPALGGWQHTADVIAALPGVAATPAQVAGKLMLLVPVLLVLLSEIGLVAFSRRAIVTTRTVILAAQSESDRPTCPTVRTPEKPGRPSKIRTVRAPKDRETALADLLTMLALGQSVPSQSALSDRWNRPKQTVSDWLRTWEAAGLIPARRQSGRTKYLKT